MRVELMNRQYTHGIVKNNCVVLPLELNTVLIYKSPIR